MKKELHVKLVIYKDYTEMHGQQNIKFFKNIFIWHRVLHYTQFHFPAVSTYWILLNGHISKYM